MKVRMRRAITLIEIMIVIFLIGLIGSVVGYNMKGSLDKGKQFKTEQAQKQVKDILLLQVAQGERIEDVVKNPQYYLEQSGLVSSQQAIGLLKDGWNEPLEIKLTRDKDIVITSKTLEKSKKKEHSKQEPQEQEDPFDY